VTGNQYRDLIAAYIHHNYADQGLVVYREIDLGKTVIGKDRRIDVFVSRPEDRKAIAIECKYQDSLGTVDEKIPYALQDLEALWVPGVLVYAGKGWSKGVMHTLEGHRLAAYCAPDRSSGSGLSRTKATRELDHVLAAIFGLWEIVLPAAKRYRARS
jgi:PD-(D/E)XK nuclease superfamily protein